MQHVRFPLASFRQFFHKSTEWTTAQLEQELSSGMWKCITLPLADIMVQDEGYSVYSKVKNALVSRGEWDWPVDEDIGDGGGVGGGGSSSGSGFGPH